MMHQLGPARGGDQLYFAASASSAISSNVWRWLRASSSGVNRIFAARSSAPSARSRNGPKTLPSQGKTSAVSPVVGGDGLRGAPVPGYFRCDPHLIGVRFRPDASALRTSSGVPRTWKLTPVGILPQTGRVYTPDKFWGTADLELTPVGILPEFQPAARAGHEA